MLLSKIIEFCDAAHPGTLFLTIKNELPFYLVSEYSVRYRYRIDDIFHLIQLHFVIYYLKL